MTTRFRDNAGAKLRYPVHSYFSAQTAYHDAHRGRGRGKLANNTYIVQDEGGAYCIVLHRTRIVCYRPDGSIVLNSGGFRTTTTKARMNEVLPPGISVWQKRYDWFVTVGGETIPFYDGMIVMDPRSTTSHSGGPYAFNPGESQRGGVHVDIHSHNPGKFSSPLDEYVYRLSLDGGNEELGDVEGFGYYARLDSITFEDVVRAATDSGEDEHSARKAWEREFKGTQLRFKDFIPAAILHEDSQGFVGVTYFASDRDADKAWNKLVEEYEEWEAESGEG